MDEQIISYPFGAVDSQSVPYAATVEVAVRNQKTMVNIGEMSGNMTVNLDNGKELRAGAELIVKTKSDATARTVTLGTGIAGTSVAGTINKTKVLTFVYDGVSFLHTGTNQID
jgi:hypothetical protein